MKEMLLNGCNITLHWHLEKHQNGITINVDLSLLGFVLLLLFATTRSVFKSVKVSVVEIAKRTN